MKYRLLDEEEKILPSDEIYNGLGNNWEIIPSLWIENKILFNSEYIAPIRRLMTPIECRAEECLQVLNNILDVAYSNIDYSDEYSSEECQSASKFIGELRV